MKKIEQKIQFNLKKEIDSEIQQFPEELLSKTEIYLGGVCDAISNIIDENPKAEFELVSGEFDYLKYGTKIVDTIKQNKKSVSTILLENQGLDLHKMVSNLKWKDKDIIILGNIDLILKVRKFSSNDNIKLHIIPTNPFVTNIFICDDDYNADIKYVPFRTVIYDTSIIYKEIRDEQIANLFVEGVASSIALLDYKFGKLCCGEQIDKVHYNRLKKVINLLMNVGKFSNANAVFLYASIELSEIMGYSDLLRFSTYNRMVSILKELNQDVTMGDILFTSYEKMLKIYYMFLNNDFSYEFSHPNYIDDITYLSNLCGIKEDYLIEKLDVPSEGKIQIYAKIIDKVRDTYLSEINPFMMTLAKVKKKYESITKKPLEQRISYQNLRDGVKLASYVAYDKTILSQCRDFGLLACIK